MERTYATALCFLEALINHKNSIQHRGTVSADGNIVFVRHFIEHCKLQPRPDSVIHLAGTKGKGTTAVMCEALMRKRGVHTALFTSPHLCSIRERIVFDGAIVSEHAFAKAFFHLYDLIVPGRENSGNTHWTSQLMEPDHFASFMASRYTEKDKRINTGLPRSLFFCFMTLLFLAAAKLHGAQVLIVETGIGGRLDATNALTGVSVCAITSIGYDHMEILGNTLHDIAREKAGIIRRRCPVVVSNSIGVQEGILAVFQRRAAERETTAFIAPRTPFSSDDRHLTLLGGSHMCENAALALAVIYLHENKHSIRNAGIAHIDFTPGDSPAHREHHHNRMSVRVHTDDHMVLDGVSYPGRSHIQTCPRTDTIFLLDGAHTPESMAHCASWAGLVIRSRPKIENVIVLFACNQPRDPCSLVSSFLNEAASFQSKLRQIVIVRAASQDKSLRGEIRQCRGHLDIATEQPTNQNAVNWQRRQADAVRSYIQDSATKELCVGEMYLSEREIRRICAPGTCIIVCGSLYHVGELLSLLSSNQV